MKASVLVVDDEPQIRRALREGLEAEGYAVDTAESGEAALSGLDQSLPDFVVLDLALPGISGLRFAAPSGAARPRRS